MHFHFRVRDSVTPEDDGESQAGCLAAWAPRPRHLWNDMFLTMGVLLASGISCENTAFIPQVTGNYSVQLLFLSTRVEPLTPLSTWVTIYAHTRVGERTPGGGGGWGWWQNFMCAGFSISRCSNSLSLLELSFLSVFFCCLGKKNNQLQKIWKRTRTQSISGLEMIQFLHVKSSVLLFTAVNVRNGSFAAIIMFMWAGR